MSFQKVLKTALSQNIFTPEAEKMIYEHFCSQDSKDQKATYLQALQAQFEISPPQIILT
ncbi:MAG: hypothetical protein WBB82_16355 [Limnothrix sp.]